MKKLIQLQHWLETIGGCHLWVPISEKKASRHILLGAWWFTLLTIIFAFIGRGTKFIYIDF